MYVRIVGRCVIALALAAMVLGAKCPGIPESRDITITVVTDNSLEMEFPAEGSLNVHAGYDIMDEDDLMEIRDQIEEVGMDPELLRWIKVSKVEYGVVEYREPEENRRIVDATVSVSRPGGEEKVLIEGLSADVYPLLGELETAPINAEGVSFMNEVLDDILEALRTGVTSGFLVEGDVEGTSEPTGRPTDFTWRVVVHYQIAGGVATESPEF